MQSKIAWHSNCNGTASRSSCSVTDGYLLRGIGSNMVTGRTEVVPSFVLTVTLSE